MTGSSGGIGVLSSLFLTSWGSFLAKALIWQRRAYLYLTAVDSEGKETFSNGINLLCMYLKDDVPLVSVPSFHTHLGTELLNTICSGLCRTMWDRQVVVFLKR